MSHTLTLENGELLTGRTWRKANQLFTALPFFTHLLRADDNIVEPLQNALAVSTLDRRVKEGLIRIADGLENHHPFSEMASVAIIVENASSILAPGDDPISWKFGRRIWGLMSSYLLFDRLCSTFGLATVSPNNPFPRTTCEQGTIGTAVELLKELTPPTKILGKFCQAWVNRRPADSNHMVVDTIHPRYDPATIALALSTRLVARGKQKALMNMTSGLEMMAMGITVCRENGGIFPATEWEFKDCLLQMGSTSLQKAHLDFLATEAPGLHLEIQNLLQAALSISPILVLSAHSWRRFSIKSIYLCRVFRSLGNDRPKSIMAMEDHILSAAMRLSHGEDLDATMSQLHIDITACEDALARDLEAAHWFDLGIPTDRLTSHCSQPLPPAETEDSSASENAVKQDLDTETYLASPPCSPHTPAAGSWVPQAQRPHSPCIDPQLLQLTRLSLAQQDIPPLTQDTPAKPTEDAHLGEDVEMESQTKSQDDAGRDNVHNEVTEDSEGRHNNTGEDQDAIVVEDGQEGEAEDGNAMKIDKGQEDEGEDNNAIRVGEAQEEVREDEEQDNKEQDDEEQGENEPDQTSMTVDEEDEGQDSEDDTKDEEQSDTAVDEGKEDHDQRVDDVQEDDDPQDEDEELEDDPQDVDEELESDHQDVDQGEGNGDQADKGEEDKQHTEDEEQADLPILDLRRSARQRDQSSHPAHYRQIVAGPRKQPGRGTSKPQHHSRATLLQLDENLGDDRKKLRDIAPSTRRPDLGVDIAGWGSTSSGGPTPYRHVPVQIVAPGNLNSTGADAETLRQLERRVQDGFVDGVPPHLLPSARSLEYRQQSDQSRFFVSPHSQYLDLRPDQIQHVLRDRHIIVPGHPFEHDYRWNLASISRLYDVDRATTVHVGNHMDVSNPEVRHVAGSLRELYEITTTLPDELCPTLNAISLPAAQRNLLVPSKWDCIASHEVAQSRVPPSYATIFDVPETRKYTEWSLIGGKDAISSIHMDCEGLGTVVIVLEGRKYWVVATEIGGDEDVSSVDALGPQWDPYVFNNGKDLSGYRFEAVHLTKGDMLIMRPGTLHWVLGTTNAICVGRHFYAASTMMPTVIGLIHTSLLGGALTNESHPETRTLLYQMMHMWSRRVDQRDVDGAHIPNIASAIEMFDVIYLGIFIILSRALDPRFDDLTNPPRALDEEIASAESHFHSLLHFFEDHYFMILEDVVMHPSYVVKRLLAEFAAAILFFAKAIEGFQRGDSEMDDAEVGEDRDVIRYSKLKVQLRHLIRRSYSDLIPYYEHCVAIGHQDFGWSGPDVRILPKTKGWASTIPFLVSDGELLDHPTFSIYNPAAPPSSATVAHTPLFSMPASKRRGSGNIDDLEAKKQRS